MKPADVVAQVRILAAAYPRTPVPAETVAVYAAALVDVDEEGLALAVARHVRTGNWFPTIAELRTSIAEAQIGAPDPESILAEIRAAIADRGYNRPPRAGDLSPIALATTEAVGWATLCESDNPEAMRAHVLKIAATLRRRAVEQVNLATGGFTPAVPCPLLDGKIRPSRQALPDRGARLGAGLTDLLDDLRPKGSP